MSSNKEKFETAVRPLAKKLMDYITTEGAAFGITDARIAIGSVNNQKNKVDGGNVTESVSGVKWSVGISLHAGDRVLHFTQNTLDFQTLKTAIDQNMSVIHMVPENPDARLLEPEKVYKGQDSNTALELFETAPPTQQELIDYARKVEAAARTVDGVKAFRGNSISRNETHDLTVASNGLDLMNSRTIYSAGISVVAGNQGGMQIDGDHSVAAHFSGMIDPTELGRSAAHEAVSRLNPVLPTSGQAVIVLSPDAANEFFESVMEAIDGTAVHRGATFLKDSLGKQVVNESITIVDDPSIRRALRSGTVDSSGMKAEKLTFIEKGVLRQFNVSLNEARKLGIEPIGRNDGPRNLIVLPGQKSPPELMADIKDGFYIRGFNGGAADVNTGRFSRQAYGNVIRNGQITDEAVAGFVVAGNLKDMFMKAVVANDTPQLPDGRHQWAIPTTRIDGMMIAGR